MEPSLSEFREAAELRAALRKFFRASERVAREEGLTPSRFLLLLMIKTTSAGRSTVTDLAERMQLTQSTVTELVTRAEAAGLVRRTQSDEDARVFWLELTRLGEERLGRAVARNGPERHRLIELIHRDRDAA
jgi:DNA-binding MarR family transcriptional regulator